MKPEDIRRSIELAREHQIIRVCAVCRTQFDDGEGWTITPGGIWRCPEHATSGIPVPNWRLPR